jgi:hypothetical protein
MLDVGLWGLGPEGGDGVGDFVLEDFDEFFAFRLTIGSALYKYMRIYLWTISSRRLPSGILWITALRIKFFRRGLTQINTVVFCHEGTKAQIKKNS